MRFITEDTNKGDVKDPLSLNLYVYCVGNPITFADFNGHDPKDLNDIMGGNNKLPSPPGGCVSFKDGLKVLSETISNALEQAGVKSFWELPPVTRGKIIEEVLGGWCNNFPIIDKAVKGAQNIATRITSIKSMDLSLKSYQNLNRVYTAIMKNVDSLIRFDGKTWGGQSILINSSTERVLELAIPQNATAGQMEIINKAILEAAKKGVEIIIRFFE